jgi:hypothetical protein
MASSLASHTCTLRISWQHFSSTPLTGGYVVQGAKIKKNAEQYSKDKISVFSLPFRRLKTRTFAASKNQEC